MVLTAPDEIPDLSGKVFLITGGNQGLGYESILHLIKHNPEHIYFTSRSSSKAEAAIEAFKAASPSTAVSFIECDLSSLQSVKDAAATFLSKSDRLDVLICNAGVMSVPQAETKDGYEIQFGTNHMGHALLTKLLLSLLQKTNTQTQDSRIVILSSDAHTMANGIDFTSLKGKGHARFPILVPQQLYGQTKLANLITATEMARRYPELMVVAVHPGIVTTNMMNSTSLAQRLAIRLSALVKPGPGVLTPTEGALNQVWAATVNRKKLRSGEYYEPVARIGAQTALSKDEELWKKLYDWTEKELEPWSL